MGEITNSKYVSIGRQRSLQTIVSANYTTDPELAWTVITLKYPIFHRGRPINSPRFGIIHEVLMYCMQFFSALHANVSDLMEISVGADSSIHLVSLLA